MDKLKKLLDDVTEIEKLLTPSEDSKFVKVRTIHSKEGFENWLSEVKYYLKKLKPEPIVQETIQFIDMQHWNGYNDEKNFSLLKAKLNTINLHYSEIIDESIQSENKSLKLKKDTIVKTAYDEYKLIEQKGLGGNGIVFSALNKNEEPVAIKFIEKNKSKEKLKRFKNEIHFCESHEHKNIVKIIDRGYAYLGEKDYAFYVMPLYCETLKDKIKNGIEPSNILKIIVGILEGLKFAHSFGTIHRDIKPENIMFEKDNNEPIILDFGIAHFAEDELLTVIETKDTERMANFQYSAPEQKIKGRSSGPQTDVYAVALILNEMFTKEIPQASGFKKIAEVNNEYEYLDKVFEQLFKQNPKDRLYPIDRILSEMQIQADIYKRELEAQQLRSVVNTLNEPGKFNAKIIDKKVENDYILFTLDRSISGEWFQILRSGRYSHCSVTSFEPQKLDLMTDNEIAMPIYLDVGVETVKDIVMHVKEWIEIANDLYTKELIKYARYKAESAEAQRKAQIENLEHTNALNDALRGL